MARVLTLLAVGVLAAVAIVATPSGGHRRAPRRVVATRRGSPRRRGRRPSRAAVERVLRSTTSVRLGPRRRRDVALTFDDGPGPWTARILRVLRRRHAPATFFVIGRWARRYPALVRREAHEGFAVGDHTEDHPSLSALAPALQRDQILEAAAAIHAAGAPTPDLFRPPYGAFDATTLSILRQARMLMVLWSADTKDYTRPGVARIAYAGISAGRPGAIVLMHDGGGDRSQTLAALPRIIHGLRAHGYHLVTVPELLSARSSRHAGA